MKAVILAAGMGSRLAPLTNDRPKPLVEVGGKPLLFRTIERLAEVGITGADVIVVSGFREDVLRARLAASPYRPTLVFNAKYEEWNNFWSLYVAREAVGDSAFLQIDGDVLFDGRLLPKLLAAPGPVAVGVEIRPDCDAEAMKVMADPGQPPRIRAVDKGIPVASAMGEYIGLTRIDPPMVEAIFADLLRFVDEGITNQYYDHSYHRLSSAGQGPFYAVDVADCNAVEIDDLNDLRRAEEMLAAGSR
jgi:L-glutamine-phosphate cytidylyltransferase